ncbi:MAG: hypothetical protein HKO87_02410 [Acidimicrobiia bacterium]|nr:hypothetical protein [Acidimicrobiia bacterium]
MEQVLGPVHLVRIGRVRFPVAAVIGKAPDGSAVTHARLGRDGWLRVYFGPGRRVRVSDGTEWRIRATGYGPYIAPMVTNDNGKLALALPHGKRSYGINGRDFAFNLYPAGRLGIRRPSWVLREHETELATLDAGSLNAQHPVPLAAALLCWTVAKFGIPGEAALEVPSMQWK